jgi:hypothetical protein
MERGQLLLTRPALHSRLTRLYTLNGRLYQLRSLQQLTHRSQQLETCLNLLAPGQVALS